MSHNVNRMESLWIIGAGGMALEYAKVLKAKGMEFAVIGRGEQSASAFEEKSGHPVLRGGLESVLQKQPSAPTAAIVAVDVEFLRPVCEELLDHGVQHVLLEKPGGVTAADIAALADRADQCGAYVALAYNRRFYASVLAAKGMIAEDGGVKTFSFEFTEWSHEIEGLPQPAAVKENWFLANSSHVVDLAFFLGGEPAEIAAFTNGSMSWHPSASAFAGAGRSKTGALFSYQANWDAPGRWGVEALTCIRRFILRPMEKLQVQKLRSVAIEPVEIDDTLDRQFKPGFALQVAAFLRRDRTDLCTIRQQSDRLKTFKRIAGY